MKGRTERARDSAKDRFIASVAHELRAPLMTIMVWEKVLRDHLDEPELRLRALDAIRDSAKIQARVVGDLLDAARAITGKLAVERVPLSVPDVLAAAITAIRPTAELRGLTLAVDIAPRIPRVRGDGVRLRQVVDNLLGNAVKFTPSGGTITVRCRRDPRHVVIDICDTGRGIPADVLPRLFVAFSQHEAHDGGLGLGLAISRQLIALHGGELTAHSDGEGRGSTFTITLPLDRARPAR